MKDGLLSLRGVPQVTPGEEGSPFRIIASAAGQALAGWLDGHSDVVWNSVREHGAVLLRGFDVGSPTEFERAVLALRHELQESYGDLPRLANCRFVQEATPYPADRAILFHNEASHTPRWPRHIWFFGERPSIQGGETPLLPCDDVLHRLPRDLVARLAAHGLRYIRTFVPGLDVSWETFFGTSDRTEVARQCLELGVEFSWLPSGGLRTSTPRPAIVSHPDTGVPLFFNQILLHHPACVDPSTREALSEWLGAENLPRNVTFGDGAPISDEVIETILEAEIAAAFCFVWQANDVLMVDNLRMAHSRRPYEGPRSIRVAMTSFQTDLAFA